MMKTYIISTIHAVISVLSVCIFYLRYTVDLTQVNRIAGGGMKGTGDEIMAYSICYSIGYFTYDFLIMLLFKSARTTSALVHHVIIIVGLLSGLFAKVGHSCHFYLLIEELSTIPLNLKSIYYDRPYAHHLLSVLFVISFLFSRLLYGTIICGYAFRTAPRFIQLAVNASDTTTLIFVVIQTVLCLALRCLNFYWGILIIRKICGLKKSKKQTTALHDINKEKKIS
ncbi:unnamed protein product [Rotaria magnacalcarata]|nr:unnamed protein product [Rotaria magnacalcarata]